MNPFQRFLPVAVIAVSALALTGCDVFQTIGDYFKGSKAEQQAMKPQDVPAQKAADPNALIQVDGWSLSAADFQQRLAALKEAAPNFDITSKDNKKAIVEELVNQEVLVKEARQSGVGNKLEINAAVEEFRRTLMIRALANQLTQNISVSDEEAQKFFEDQKQYMVTPAAWHLRAIVVDDKDKANTILAEILSGADFAEKAKIESKIPGAAQNGGDVGFITAEQIPFPELANEILTLNPGDVSKAFQGPDGFYLIKLEEKKGGEALAFENIKEDIKANLRLQKQQEFMINRTKELREKAKITVNEGLL